MNIDLLAILRPHRALMHRLGRTDGHAVAAVNAEVPPVFDADGKILLGNQTARARPDLPTPLGDAIRLG